MKTIANSLELGAAIRAERKRLRVTQKELAMAAGTGLRFLSELERGKPTSRLEGVFKVLQALGLELRIRIPEGRMTEPHDEETGGLSGRGAGGVPRSGGQRSALHEARETGGPERCGCRRPHHRRHAMHHR